MGSGPGAAPLAAPVPDVELDLKEYTSADRMQEVLLAGEADIAVGPRPTRTDEHTELLGREEIVLVASPEHRFAGLACVPLAELATEPLVHYHPDNGFAVWVDQFAAEQGVALPSRRCVRASRVRPRSWRRPAWA